VIVIEEPSPLGDSFETWLAATNDVIGSFFDAAGNAIQSFVKSLPPSDEVKDKAGAVALIMKTRGVDAVRAEAIYQQYLKDVRTATPKDAVQSSLKNE
jgi:hypothetical protein